MADKKQNDIRELANSIIEIFSDPGDDAGDYDMARVYLMQAAGMLLALAYLMEDDEDA